MKKLTKPELVRIVKTYGEHKLSCVCHPSHTYIRMRIEEAQLMCTCGFKKVLKQLIKVE